MKVSPWREHDFRNLSDQGTGSACKWKPRGYETKKLWEYESSRVREYVSTRYETMILYDYETMKLWDYDDDMVRAEDDNEDEESREQRVEKGSWSCATVRACDYNTMEVWDDESIRLLVLLERLWGPLESTGRALEAALPWEHAIIILWKYETMSL